MLTRLCSIYGKLLQTFANYVPYVTLFVTLFKYILGIANEQKLEFYLHVFCILT